MNVMAVAFPFYLPMIFAEKKSISINWFIHFSNDINYAVFVCFMWFQIYGADGSLLRAESRRGRGKGRGGGAVSSFSCI